MTMYVNSRRFIHVISLLGPDQPPVTLRAIVPSNRVGAMIGEQGKVHRQIQDPFNVQVYIHSQSDRPGRLVNTFGGIRGVSRAWRDAFFWMFCSRREYSYGQKAHISFLVPTPLIDYMLEHSALEKIQKMTKIEILLRRTPLKMTTEHLLSFSIPTSDASYLDKFEQAVFMLATHFQKHVDKSMSPYNVYYIPHMANTDENSSSAVAEDDVLQFVESKSDHLWHEEFKQ